MHEAGQKRAGTMAAVLGLGGDIVIEVCKQATTAAEVVVAANLNEPNQTVISGDPAAVERAGGTAVMTDPAEAQRRIARLRALEDDLRCFRVVTVAGTGEPVGAVMLQPIPLSGPTEPLRPSGDTEIGWHFHPGHWGHGYASDAAGLLLETALADGLPRVVAVTYPENTASQRVCERIGMRREAHLVQNEWFKGEWTDELDYAILADEWRAARAGSVRSQSG